LPLFFHKTHGFRSLPVVTPRPFRDRWDRVRPEVQAPRMRVALFGGCLVDFVYPEQAEAVLPLLKEQGVAVDYPMDQTCCGLPALMAAEKETAREVAIQNIRAFEESKCDWILTLCASCGSHLKENYPKLLGDDPKWKDRLEAFTSRVIDFSSFLMQILKVRPELFHGTGTRTAYHAPCHLCRGLKVVEEPRKLLEIAGLNYVPAQDEDVCCGFAGSYSLEFPEISAELLQRKLDSVEATGAELLVTDCPGCVLQLRGGMDQRGGRIRVRHIAEAVAEGLS
ncbi:Cysteine-rich domain-containing protein, partial [Desulfacinum hydrothermale DSM 13146]